MGRTYRVGEVARRFEVSVRTLHHYDERGLLVPSARSESGYRLYTDDDLARLVEILALRALGLRLGRIGVLLDRPGADPERALRLRRMAIRRQIADLAALNGAIGEVLERGVATGDWLWNRVAPLRAPRLTEQELEELVEKHYTAEQLATFEELAAEIGPEEIAAVEQAWATLIPEVRAARDAGIDPAGAEAQALGARWRALVDRSFRGRTELREAVGAAYQAGAFAADPSLPNGDDFAFISAVEAARPD
jgi:MerR family transcriptional regulator, thiopeptide resistance regulator